MQLLCQSNYGYNPEYENLSEEEKEAFASETSLNRFGTPEEVAESILFLAENEYVTGQNLVVDGGYLQ